MIYLVGVDISKPTKPLGGADCYRMTCQENLPTLPNNCAGTLSYVN